MHHIYARESGASKSEHYGRSREALRRRVDTIFTQADLLICKQTTRCASTAYTYTQNTRRDSDSECLITIFLTREKQSNQISERAPCNMALSTNRICIYTICTLSVDCALNRGYGFRTCAFNVYIVYEFFRLFILNEMQMRCLFMNILCGCLFK